MNFALATLYPRSDRLEILTQCAEFAVKHFVYEIRLAVPGN